MAVHSLKRIIDWCVDCTSQQKSVELPYTEYLPYIEIYLQYQKSFRFVLEQTN